MSLMLLQDDFRDWLQYGPVDTPQRLGLADARGLAVYQNNYRAQLLGCLEESFPQTLAWTGDDGFRAAAATHIDRCPPHSWTLDDYPAGFPAALSDLFPDNPEVAELADLELRLSEAFVAADAPTLDIQALGSVDWDRAELKLAPDVSFLKLRTNAAVIWSALAAGDETPAGELLPEASIIVVWRQDFVCCFRPLDVTECEVLPTLMQGRTFASLCGELIAALDEEAGVVMAGTLLARWAGEGLLLNPEHSQ